MAYWCCTAAIRTSAMIHIRLDNKIKILISSSTHLIALEAEYVDRSQAKCFVGGTNRCAAPGEM